MKSFFRKYKYKILFVLAAGLTIAVIFSFFSIDNITNSKNIEFIASYGWAVEDSPAEISYVSIPEELSGIYLTYADVSSIGSSSITNYSGKTLTRYSYTVLNHKMSDTHNIRANVLVYRSEIVAAEISNLSQNGTTTPISDTAELSQ